ncbi:hypothetical protein GpartN1_g1458.t1 [Galdieria partita]|uniref:Uncharacterized protein n=1 Tax=Galdieria partita TaxID=83374 RepID=A0A9C7UNP8_9RHOD|nr:hypothetical protein GpartN1_g1458.t1 [Galdieria partita]
MSHTFHRQTAMVRTTKANGSIYDMQVKTSTELLEMHRKRNLQRLSQVLSILATLLSLFLFLCVTMRLSRGYIYRFQFQRRFKENEIYNPTFKLLGMSDEQVLQLAKKTGQEPENIAEVYSSEVFPYVVDRTGIVRRPEIVKYFIFDFERWMNFTKEMKARREESGDTGGCI